VRLADGKRRPLAAFDLFEGSTPRLLKKLSQFDNLNLQLRVIEV
jgi:hypothetical protein